jgi:hypothetical protein
MRRSPPVPLLAVLVLAGPWALAVPASAQTFSASVDRFEVDGNSFGPFDGAADFVDEFDNGTLAPDWAPLLGFAIELGGVVTVRDPGEQIPVPGIDAVVSNIENEHEVLNGDGNFTATAYWLPVAPATNTGFHFQTYAVGGIIEAAGLSFTNFSPEVAAGQPGALAGPAVTQQLTYIGGPTPPPAFATVAVNPAAITGHIVFRLSFDDATDTLTTAFSLDDGATFQSPFPPLQIFNGVSGTEFLLGATAATNVLPPTFTYLVATRLFLARNPTGDPLRRKVVIKLPGVGFSYPPVTGATLAVRLDGTTQCFHLPASGWSARGLYLTRFVYSDPDGVHGTVKRAEQLPTGVLVITILGRLGPIDLVPSNPATEAATNFRTLGIPNNVSGAENCSSTSGGTVGPNTARSFRVVNAPAPSACQVAACSPSGAFLDE